jgi:hypothetical protein
MKKSLAQLNINTMITTESQRETIQVLKFFSSMSIQKKIFHRSIRAGTLWIQVDKDHYKK